MERRRTNVALAPASQQEVSISIPGGDAANSVQPLQNGLLEANIVHSTSSSSSIQTPDINSNSTQAPDSDTNQGGTSSQFNLPSLHLLQDKKQYSHKCVPLYKAALKGDCNEAKRILGDDHQSMLRAAVTKGYQTILHVATGAKQTNFVKQMVELTGHDNLLTLQDENGNTAFCFAAAVGSVEIAQFMLQRNPNLLTIRGGGQMTPLYIAALFGQSKMASFLYRQNEDNLEPDDLENTFFVSIETGLYGLALQLLKKNKKLLAGATHAKYGTAMHMLARNPSAFTSNCPGWLKVPGIKFITNNTDSSTQALELVKCLWKEISKSTHEDVLKLISKPSKLLFDAAHSGNFKFLAVLTRSYPDLVHQLDENGRSIFHIAVMHRHADTFKLIYEMGFDKELIATYVDVSGNNLLHLAAQYSNPKPISKVPGAALEMQQELKTFKEVETIVKPSFKEMKNNDGKTPWELFTDEHKTLLEEAEKWMKSRAESCSIVATLATAGVFQAAFTPPVGQVSRDECFAQLTHAALRQLCRMLLKLPRTFRNWAKLALLPLCWLSNPKLWAIGLANWAVRNILPHLSSRRPRRAFMLEPLDVLSELPQIIFTFPSGFALGEVFPLHQVLAMCWHAPPRNRAVRNDVVHIFVECGDNGSWRAPRFSVTWFSHVFVIWLEKAHMEDRMDLESWRKLELIRDVAHTSNNSEGSLVAPH
ncbi:ANK REP REGION domain-containing protein [Citrus sinensis]|uniref:ANK REP REGION domain-containing protein n=1 Tax=Citrus sinensis TaxID=2711 RepID=A0ACB8KFS0_CITSI|nr:ANK REP REGION domain-containing protein [Citrus sinensis]